MLLWMLGWYDEETVQSDIDIVGDGFNVLADISFVGQYEETVFDRMDGSLRSGASAYFNTVSALIGAYSKLEMRDAQGRTALARAAGNHQWPFVEMLLRKGCNAESRDLAQPTPLLTAIRLPKKETTYHNISITGRGVAFLGALVVKRGIGDPRTQIRDQERKQWSSALQMLIGSTWDLRTTDSQGRNALSLAAETSEPDIVRLLLERGVDVNHTDNEGISALMWACRTPRQWNVVFNNVTIGGTASVYAGGLYLHEDKRANSTELPFANNHARSSRLDTNEMLLRHAANPNLSASNGQTALSFAAADNLQDVVDLLIRFGASSAP